MDINAGRNSNIENKPSLTPPSFNKGLLKYNSRGGYALILVRNALLVLFTAVMFIPLYSTIINAFKEYDDIVSAPFSLFTRLSLDNFKIAFTNPNTDILLMYRNSIIITTVSLAILLVITPMAGYYLARTNDKKSRFLMMLLLAGLMIPDEITLIPLVRMYVSADLIGKLPGMFIYYAGHNSVVAIFMYSKFIKSIPYELEESALMDGASRFRVFWQIVFPLLKPCTATVLVFVGLHIWNDFMIPLYLLKGTGSLTITLGIYTALGPFSSNWGQVFSFVIIAAAPIVIMYIFMQKWFISGLTSGAVKG